MKKLETYLLSTIDGDGYDVTPETPEQKIKFVFDCFEREFNHRNNRIRYPQLRDRFAQYLMGLPSCISVPFTYNKIIALSKEMGYYTSIDEDYIIENHFNFMAQNIVKLRDKYLRAYDFRVVQERR